MDTSQGKTFDFTDPTIAEALSNEFYCVPEYQREYVWETRHVETLIKDIYDAYVEDFNKDYFVGTIVVYPNGGTEELVDGQQRMTTFLLMLCAMRKMCEKNGSGNVGNLSKLIMDSGTTRSGESFTSYRIELQYQNANDEFARIATSDFPVSGDSNLVEAVNAAYTFLSQLFTDPADLDKFIGYFINGVKFVRIKTYNIADALKTFETINQRGVGLNAVDLLKNMLFRQVERDQFEKLNELWKSMIDTVKEAGEKPMRFLRYYLMATFDTQSSSELRDGILREGELFGWLTRHSDLTGYEKDPFGFLEKMKNGADTYARFMGMEYGANWQGAGGDVHIANISALGGSSTKYHLMLLMAAKQMEPATLAKFKAMLETIVYHSTVNRVNTNAIERLLPKWCAGIREIVTIPELDSFVESEITPVLRDWSEGERESFLLLGYSNIQQYRIRFILYRIAQYIATMRTGNSSVNPADLGSIYKEKPEIEHIMPDTYKGDVPPYGLTEEEYERYKSMMGNLSPLEKTINGSIQNDDYATKLESYKKSGYYLTKSIAGLDDVGANTAINRVNADLRSWTTWGVASIKERQEMLYSLSLKIWSFDDWA